jgi:ribonuclease Z
MKREFNVTILGNGSAVPTATQHPSSQIVLMDNEKLMIDCGEGAQMQMIRYNIKHRHLNRIFISHLHGDHYFGLFGLISTFHLFGRERPLELFAPAELKALLDHQLKVSNTQLRFPLIFHPLEDYQQTPLFTYNDFEARVFPLYHRMPAWGLKITYSEKELKIDKKFISRYHPSVEQIHEIKKGSGFVSKTGEKLDNESITLPPEPEKSYAYCSDTAYNEKLVEAVKGADLLYHEATFDLSMKEEAAGKFHSTSVDAATIALKAGVKKLLLGHYSARFEDLSELLEQAKSVFPDTLLSEEGKVYQIDF